MYRLEELTKLFPTIPWRVPLPVQWIGGGMPTFACRVCVANHGLNQASSHQWTDEDGAQAHVLKEHMLAALS